MSTCTKKAALEALHDLSFCLEEAHTTVLLEEYETIHPDKAMRMHRDDEPDCSYCRALKQADEVLGGTK